MSSCIVLIFIIIILIVLWKCNSKNEGYYFNDNVKDRLGEEGYPSYFASSYGKYGENWPYAEP